jgi:glycerol-3-phosphate acyltransferase PlsY
MSTTNRQRSKLARAAPIAGTREKVRKVLLACGPLSSLLYIGWHEVAALQWGGYSHISNSISELHLTGTPSGWVLEPWLILVYNPLVIAFGIGVWQSARGRPAVRVIGSLLILSGATFPLWLLFGEASLAAHIILSVIGILTWLGAMGFGAAAFGRRFRVYSLATLATVVTFFALAFTYTPEVAAGEPTPFFGLFERIAFSAYFLWVSVLAVVLWRTRADRDREAADEDRPGVPALPAPSD